MMPAAVCLSMTRVNCAKMAEWIEGSVCGGDAVCGDPARPEKQY